MLMRGWSKAFKFGYVTGVTVNWPFGLTAAFRQFNVFDPCLKFCTPGTPMLPYRKHQHISIKRFVSDMFKLCMTHAMIASSIQDKSYGLGHIFKGLA